MVNKEEESNHQALVDGGRASSASWRWSIIMHRPMMVDEESQVLEEETFFTLSPVDQRQFNAVHHQAKEESE